VITAGRLPDKPSPDGERTGTERARADARWIAAHAPPLLEAAKQLIRERYPDAVVLTRGFEGATRARRVG
jgi:hypothetical protein